ncbi:MAG: hypothetical protein JNJ58_12240 [Chitinophagaceae bacterium]|nr:hypothetical protein [Chitinophagaceae bacterium]
MTKQYIISLGLLLCLTTDNLWATVRTVLNVPSGLAQFNDIQSAADASVSGDTIYIHGSTTTYASFTVTNKKLVYIGPGYATQKTQALSAKIFHANIENYSNLPGSASGTEFHGLQVTGTLAFGGPFTNGVAVNNVLIQRCYFTGSSAGVSMTRGNTTYSNYIFQSNYFHATFFNANASGTTYVNMLFRNNVVLHQGTSNTFMPSFNNSTGLHIDHNLFYGTGTLFGTSANNPNFATITNNIFINVAGIGNTQNSLYQNNLTFSTNHSAPWTMGSNYDGGGNMNANPLMVNQVALTANALDVLMDFNPGPGSPCLNAGTDGLNLGVIYQTNSPDDWAQSRNGVLPYLVSLNVPNAANLIQGSTTPVQINAVKGK